MSPLIYKVHGRPGEALPLAEWALAVTEAAYGPDYPNVGIRLSNAGRPGPVEEVEDDRICAGRRAGDSTACGTTTQRC